MQFSQVFLSLFFLINLMTVGCVDDMPVYTELTPEEVRAPAFVPQQEPQEAVEESPEDALVKENDEPQTPPKININIATPEELDTLPGVGPSMAARIIKYREKRRARDLRRVHGIGKSKWHKLKGLVTVK